MALFFPGGECFAGATPTTWYAPLVGGILGRPVYSPSGTPPLVVPDDAPPVGASPAGTTGAAAPGPAAQAVAVPAMPGEGLPFSLASPGGDAGSTPRRAIRLGPPEGPISAAELHALVAPAVVALVASKPAGAPQLAAGVLTTASGLILTSRSAIANALARGGKLAAVHAGPRGHFGSHELAEAVPARVLASSDELDLALVEALPAEVVFYPHLPVARRTTGADTVLAVGHRKAKERGLWSATVVGLAPSKGKGTARWLRDVAPGLAAGTPLVDGAGRVVALVTEPQPGVTRAIDADALLRFLIMGQAPARRFAGVPPFRRPSTLLTRAARVDSAAAAPSGPLAGLLQADSSDQAMPGVSDKGSLDRRLQAAEPRAVRRPPVPEKSDVSADVSFDEAANVLPVTSAELERQPVPEVVKVDVEDAPERGSHAAWVTIIELGDYHAAETRLAEPAIHALVEGDGAPARLVWKDADRGDGAGYLLAARTARAAGEQDDFWSMHDRLLQGKGAKLAHLEDARRLAREQELDLKDFDVVMSGDGLSDALEADGERAGRIPALATPSFIVNGHVVDGGSVAGPALRVAVEEELAMAAARTEKRPLSGSAANRCRGIVEGKPIAGTTSMTDSLAAKVLAAAGRGDAPARRPSRH